MKDSVKAYIDLTRFHFSFVWPLLFCSGLMLAFQTYGGFSWALTVRAALIALFGFEAGLVLNDYVDRDIDKKDVEFDKLTKYWRIFQERPIPAGLISPKQALWLFILLVLITTTLIFTLPYPNSLYVFGIMVYSYGMEYFYQIKKRNQQFPIAQILGRTDFALFPIAGYLCYGSPDKNVLLFFIFFYPWTLAHLAINDIIDIKNDTIKKLKTIPLLYGINGTVYWITAFSIFHFIGMVLFLNVLGNIAVYGFMISTILIVIANGLLIKTRKPIMGLKILPMFHASLFVYAISIIINSMYM